MTIKDMKPGMNVFIREDLKVGGVYENEAFVKSMEHLTGLQKITEIGDTTIKVSNERWHFTSEMIDWEKTKKLNIMCELTYDGTTLEGQINGKEIKVIRSYKDKDDLEKAAMMGLLKSLGYNYGDVKKLQSEIKKVWRPKFMEKYYYIMSNLEVNYIYNDGYSIDERRIQVGNCFKTEEEAEKKVVEIISVLKK